MNLAIGLGISFAVLIYVAQKNLYLAMFAAATIMGLITLPFKEFIHQVYLTFSDPSIVSLSSLVFLIAMIGGILEESGGMADLVKNMRIGKKPFLAASPALLGMLPMPGGALLSAPMVDRSGKELEGSTKAALNVWFRHILFLVYPLSTALIASAKIAKLTVYSTIPFLFPFFLLAFFLGYFFYLREASEKMEYEGDFSLKGLLVPLTVILLAPIIDIVIKSTINPEVTELATLIGVFVSFVAAVLVSGYRGKKLLEVGKKMKPWSFSLIIFGMFTFLNVFVSSGAPETLGKADIPLPLLLVVIAFVLGLATGRIQAPISIVVPIFLARFGESSMPLIAFSITYFSVFVGYAISPIHPCVSVSIEYFDTSIRDYVGKLVYPSAISLGVLIIISYFIL